MHSPILWSLTASTLSLFPSVQQTGPQQRSSHLEAPAIKSDALDGTDVYAFMSYEPGRSNFVTLIANYQRHDHSRGGAAGMDMPEDALFEVYIDNDGDAEEDITFRFQFENEVQGLTQVVGPVGFQENVPIPFRHAGPLSAGSTANQNVVSKFILEVIHGDRRTGTKTPIVEAGTGQAKFLKPENNVGSNIIPDYSTYSGAYIYDIILPGAPNGRVFVGQRKDPDRSNSAGLVGTIGFNPLGPTSGGVDSQADMNVTTLAVEVPVAFLTNGSEPVIGVWSSASLRQSRTFSGSGPKPGLIGHARGGFDQLSRMGSPSINDLIVGLDSNREYDEGEPKDDARFRQYVEKPTLPEILELLFGVTAPEFFPRLDLDALYNTGFAGLNLPNPANLVPGEMLRLNTAIPPTSAAFQEELGAIAGDPAGYPNGRRPGDDVVDITLRILMGALLDPSLAPDGQLPFTDQVQVDASFFDEEFPYLRDPLPGGS